MTDFERSAGWQNPEDPRYVGHAPLPDRIRLAEAQAQVDHLQGRIDAVRAVVNSRAAMGSSYSLLLDELRRALGVES